LVKLLLANKADVNASRSASSVTPLCMSVLNGHTEWVKLLLGNKPDWSTCDNDGVTPLTVAGHILHTEVVKLPLDNNANLNASRRTDCVTTL